MITITTTLPASGCQLGAREISRTGRRAAALRLFDRLTDGLLLVTTAARVITSNCRAIK